MEEARANLREAMHKLFERRYSSTLYRLEFGKSGGGREEIQLEEVPTDQRAPILKA